MPRAACVLCQRRYGERTNTTGEEKGCPDIGEGGLVGQVWSPGYGVAILRV